MAELRIYGNSPAGAAANEILARAAANPTRILLDIDNSIRLSWISEEHEIYVNVDPGGRATFSEKIQYKVVARDVPFEEVADSFYEMFMELPANDLAFGCPTASWVGYPKRG